MTVRVGVVGAGGHSRRSHAPALEHLAGNEDLTLDVDPRAVCDLDAERARSYAAAFGFAETYEEYGRMLDAEDLDAVVAVTPIPATRDVGGDLLARRVPVLIEKPPGATVAETRELHAIADRHDAPHMLSFNRRFNPAIVRAREWLADAPAPPDLAVARLWRVDRLEEGFVVNTGLHAVDTVCSFLGNPARTDARRWQSRPAGGECCVARVDFGDATAQVTLAPDAGTRAETYELLGPGYRVRIDVTEPRLTVSTGGETAIAICDTYRSYPGGRPMRYAHG